MDKKERTEKIIDRIAHLSKKCKKCTHVRLSHLEGRCIAANATDGEYLLMCKCKEFVPSDNLDYIEWLAKKKGLIK